MSNKFLDEATEISDSTELSALCGWEDHTLTNKHLLVCVEKGREEYPALLVLQYIAHALKDYVFGIGFVVDLYTKKSVRLIDVMDNSSWEYCNGATVLPTDGVSKIISGNKLPDMDNNMSVGVDLGDVRHVVDLKLYEEYINPPLGGYPPAIPLSNLTITHLLTQENLPAHRHGYSFQYRPFRDGDGERTDGSYQVVNGNLWRNTGTTFQQEISTDSFHRSNNSDNPNNTTDHLILKQSPWGNKKFWGFNYNFIPPTAPPPPPINPVSPYLTVRKIIKMEDNVFNLPKY